MGISIGYQMYRIAGRDPGTARWEQTEGGKDRSVPAVIFMPWALSCTISDALVAMLLRPILEQAIDMGQFEEDGH